MNEITKTYAEIQNKYMSSLRSFCFPILNKMETKRKILYSIFIILLPLAILSIIGVIVIGIMKLEKLTLFTPFMMIFPMIVFAIYVFLTKNLEKEVKKHIMPILCKAIGDINWKQSPVISHDLYIDSKILPNTFNKVKVDDVFNGSYKGINYNIVEAQYSKKEFRHTREGRKTEYLTIFDGLLITLDMNKNFNSHTVIRTNLFGRFIPNGDLKHTVFENIEFEEKFDVFTNNEVEARYLITSSFMEHLNNVKMSFIAPAIECAFYRDKLIISLQGIPNMFHVGSVWKPLTDEKQYFKMFEEILSIIKLIDHFKLDQKIGL